MSLDLSFFDAAQVEPSTGGATLPPGRYPVVICGAEAKPTKDGDSGMLVLEFKVIQGPQSNSTIKARLNLWNKNEMAAKIAAGELSAVYHCVGKFRVQNPAELFNIPMQIEVVPQKSNPEYTEIGKYFDANGNPPGKAGQGASVAAPAAAGNGVSGVQPWGAPPATEQPAAAPAPAPAPAAGWGAPAATAAPAPATGGWAAPGAAAGGWAPPSR